MGRTIKGSKPPGWEPWSHRHERQQPAPDYDTNYDYDDEADLAMYCFLYGPCHKCTQEEE